MVRLMRYNIAICDDAKADIEYIASLVNRWAEKEKIAIELSTFSSAEGFLFQYEEQKNFQILLLDVEMHGMSGIDLAKKLRREKNQLEIVFITSHFELSGEGYEVDALHYLVKPIAQSKLAEVLSKAVQRLAVEPPSVIIHCDGETVRLYEQDIRYVEAFMHYIVIYAQGREYRLKEKISAFAGRLSEDFYQTHRSYIVSLKKIVRISRSSVCLEDGTELPLARGKYDDIHCAYIKRN